MGRKVKIVKSKKSEKEINDLFNQMIGTGGSINVNICYKKYSEMKTSLVKIAQVLSLLHRSKILNVYDEFLLAESELGNYVSKVNDKITEYFSADYSHIDYNLNLLPEQEKIAFSNKYEAIKSLDIITDFLETSRNLLRYKKYLADKDHLDYKFILKIPGVEFCPFPFMSLNLKRLVTILSIDMKSGEGTSNDPEENKKVCAQLLEYLMLLVNKLMILTHNLYKVYTSPDVDVNEFVQVIMSNINEVKKHIPARCDKAFKLIEESVDLLKDNFPTYYKDFTESGDQGMIMENFILDVSKTAKADPQTTAQFREIIKFYRKQAQHHVKNPQMKKILKVVEEKFSMIDKDIRKYEKNEDLYESSGESLGELSESDEESCDEEIIAENVRGEPAHAPTEDRGGPETSGKTEV